MSKARETMPSRQAIAEYWYSSAGVDRWPYTDRNFGPFFLGQPCCWACGYFAQSWNEGSTKNAWNRTNLDRAHIIAASAGGSNEPGNFVLLCWECHEAAPMTVDESDIFRFIRYAVSRDAKIFDELKRQTALLGFTEDQYKSILARTDLSSLMRQACEQAGIGQHFGTRGASVGSTVSVIAGTMRLGLAAIEAEGL